MQITPSSFNVLQDMWTSKVAQASEHAKTVHLSVVANAAQELHDQAANLASAIVHLNADKVPEGTYRRLNITAINVRGPDIEKINMIGKEMNSFYSSMRAEWHNFRSSLNQTAPDLAGKDFGFTVDQHG